MQFLEPGFTWSKSRQKFMPSTSAASHSLARETLGLMVGETEARGRYGRLLGS